MMSTPRRTRMKTPASRVSVDGGIEPPGTSVVVVVGGGGGGGWSSSSPDVTRSNPGVNVSFNTPLPPALPEQLRVERR